MAQQTVTVEGYSTYKADRVSERLVTDGGDVWVENDEDNRIGVDELEAAIEAIENGAEEVSFGDVTVNYAERHAIDRVGWRGEDSEKGIPIDIGSQSHRKTTNIPTVKALLNGDTSAKGVECVESAKKLTKSSVNLVTDGIDLWYEGYDSENDRITLEQARDAIEMIENGAEEVSFENDVSIEEQIGGIYFHYSDGRRAVQTKDLKNFVEDNI